MVSVWIHFSNSNVISSKTSIGMAKMLGVTKILLKRCCLARLLGVTGCVWFYSDII